MVDREYPLVSSTRGRRKIGSTYSAMCCPQLSVPGRSGNNMAIESRCGMGKAQLRTQDTQLRIRRGNSTAPFKRV